jgi:hypothetical protein
VLQIAAVLVIVGVVAALAQGSAPFGSGSKARSRAGLESRSHSNVVPAPIYRPTEDRYLQGRRG